MNGKDKMELTQEHYRVGKVAYDGYRKQSGGKSLASGEPIPEWDGLSQPIKDAWAAAGIAVHLEIAMGQRRCQHEPVIMHRTGGLPAALKNTCGKCGVGLTRVTAADPWTPEYWN